MEQPNSTTATRTNVEDVVRVVRQIIAQRELMPGEKLGTERALAELLGVSRSNLRVALAELESNHEIVRKIGRAGGIVVSDGRLERNLNTVESLTQIAKRQGWALQSIVLSAVVAPASASDMRLLRLPADRPTVYAVTRLRMLGDAPLSVETNHLPAYLFPGFLNRDLSMSFYGLFQQEYKIRPQRVDETLDYAPACEAAARRHCGSTVWPMTSRAGRASAPPMCMTLPASDSRCTIRGLCGCPHHSGESHKPRMVVRSHMDWAVPVSR